MWGKVAFGVETVVLRKYWPNRPLSVAFTCTWCFKPLF